MTKAGDDQQRSKLGVFCDENIDSLVAINQALREEVVSLLLSIYSLQEAVIAVDVPDTRRQSFDKPSYA